MEILGTGGLRLLDYWKSKDGPEAYYGIAVPNFPNFFMILGMSRCWSGGTHKADLTRTVGAGPNTAGGHASVLFNEEVQVRQTQSSLSRCTRHLVRVCGRSSTRCD